MSLLNNSYEFSYEKDKNYWYIKDSNRDNHILSKFQETVYNLIKIIIHLDQTVDLDILNQKFKKILCGINLEYDHSHEANTDIEYFVNDKFILNFRITDMNRKWKTLAGEIIYFTFDIKDFKVAANCATSFENVPLLVKNKLLISYNHIYCFIRDAGLHSLIDTYKDYVKVLADKEFSR